MRVKNYRLNQGLSWVVNSKSEEWLQKNDNEFASCKVKELEAPLFEVLDLEEMVVSKDGVVVSEGVTVLMNTLIIQDKQSNKRLKIIALENGKFTIEIETGFTFHYYAAILDAFIKLIAITQDIIPLHASAALVNDKLSIYCAWRRMGKTTIVLNLLAQNKNIRVLADDAVFIDRNGAVIPYLRGIDLYPYLPISDEFLTVKNRLKRYLAKFISLPIFKPKNIFHRISQRFFTPRLNFANVYSVLENKVCLPINVHMVNKSRSVKSVLNNRNKKEVIPFIARSSYFEILEYHVFFEMLVAQFPNSRFSNLLIDYPEFERLVKLNLGSPENKFHEVSLSHTYQDLDELGTVLGRDKLK